MEIYERMDGKLVVRDELSLGHVPARCLQGGATVVISGPRGNFTVRIVDLCTECPAGIIDLSPQAFRQIADTVLGRVPISWYVTASNVSGSILYHFMDASSRYWMAVQIRN